MGVERRQPIRGFRDLEVFQRSRALQAPVYKIAEGFPDFEKYDLADQLRRACKSVAANIAEGYATRESVKEFKRYLRVSMASANEMEVHLETARDLGYLTSEQCTTYVEQYQILGKQLHRLIESWKSFK